MMEQSPNATKAKSQIPDNRAKSKNMKGETGEIQENKQEWRKTKEYDKLTEKEWSM